MKELLTDEHRCFYHTNPNISVQEGLGSWKSIGNKRGYSQVGGLALLHLLALAAGGGFLAAQRARDAHQQAAVAQEEAADVHQHQEQQQRAQAQPNHSAVAQAAEQGFC